jgi:hypothetical protein
VDRSAPLDGKALIDSAIHPDGSLDSCADLKPSYFTFYPGNHHAILDGEFAAATLRAIADYMEAHGG